MLHRKLRRVLEAEDLIEGSHDYKAAVALFDTFPKDELFAAPVDDLRRAVVALLALEGTDRVRLLGRRARDGRSASFILALPRDRYRALLVERVTRLFKRRFKAKDVEAQHMLGEGGTRVRVHFLVHAPDGLPEIENAELEREVVQLARTWDDALRDALAERFGAARGRLLRSIWAAHLPEHYKGYTSPHVGALDIALLEQLSEQGPFLVSLQPLAAAHAGRALRARAEGRAGRGAADARGPRAARDRGDLDAADRRRRDVGAGVPRARARRGAAGPGRGRRPRGRAAGRRPPRRRPRPTTSTGWSSPPGWTGGQVAILRAYRKYRQRVGSRFTESYQNDVLVANSAITAKLVRFFELRFDPELETDEAAEAALREEILADLDEVASLDHDRILRNQLTVIEATLRTNAYNARPRGAGVQAASPRDVPAMPQPAPYREIYVYSPRGGGHPPARRADRPRRPALVGPAGLPHRGLRADARAADQERRDRARGREGRLLHQARRRRRAPLRHVHPLAAVA